ncbi:hypothetical protein N7456_006592 [Penicillium angulare]|uniref:Uncharacterized protein n=1 Tax=Penicillium angulare TaxID=116970 RepID=A0A9W9FI42_9EURO|nr:hypothetical protein N7456_006592 [Penicillium angulare]
MQIENDAKEERRNVQQCAVTAVQGDVQKGNASKLTLLSIKATQTEYAQQTEGKFEDGYLGSSPEFSPFVSQSTSQSSVTRNVAERPVGLHLAEAQGRVCDPLRRPEFHLSQAHKQGLDYLRGMVSTLTDVNHHGLDLEKAMSQQFPKDTRT